MYRRALPAIELSIEKGTPNVPNDSKYYVLHRGKTLGSFRSLKKAEGLFTKIVEESGYKPPRVEAPKEAPGQASIERWLTAKDLYWAESHKYRTGGKGGRGGI